MTSQNQPQVPSAPPSPEAWLTTGSLVLIGIGAVLAILLIWWGGRLKRERKTAERDVLERQDERHDEVAADTAPPPAARPIDADADIVPAASPPTPPVAPSPPPLESSDTPVVAAAPLDASPAAIAADVPPFPRVVETDGNDDLTQLKGVGPKLAVRLGELGVTRYAQIAELSDAEAQALDAQLGAFQGRMSRDRWIEQARYLARGDRDGFEAAFGKL